MKRTLNYFSMVFFAIFTISSLYAQNDTILVYVPYVYDFQVDDNDSAYFFAKPCIAVDGPGNFVIAWEDVRGTDIDIYAQRLSHTGIPQGKNFRVNEEKKGIQCEESAISMNAYGNCVICWNTRRENVRDFNIFAQCYSSSGDTMGSNFQVNENVDHDHCYGVSVAMDNNGNFIITWREQRDKDVGQIYAQRYSADGTALDGNFLVCETDDWQIDPDIAMTPSGDFVITWADERNGTFDIYARRFYLDGTGNGEEFQVSDPAPGILKYNPAVSINQQGDFVIAWSHGFGENDIYAQCYHADGSRSGDNFKVNLDVYSEFRGSASVSINNDGQFVIGWMDNDSTYNFYIRRYAADHSTVENPFHPPTTQPYMCHYIDLQFTNGFLYNVWNANEGIYANIYDLINYTTTGIEIEPINRLSNCALYQNYPNPANPSTTIDFKLTNTESVKLLIYDITGRKVRTLIDDQLGLGMYHVTWNGFDDESKSVSSGLYFYKLEAGPYQKTHKMIVTR